MDDWRDEPPWRWSLTQLGQAYASRRSTPLDALDAVLARIDAVNPSLNAFAHLDVDGARRAASRSTERWRSGTPLSPLDGAILSVKDNITVEGLPCAWGTEVYRDYVPAVDEVPVARLRAAGVVILGKTTVSEFSNGRGIVSTRLFGTTRNPWRLERTTGSSSAGACAAVSSGMGAAALGTDGGGSIRIPASHCGLVGLKPSVGRVARAHGLPVILGGREVIGPIARTVEDLAMLMRAIGAPHAEDATSWAFGPADWSLGTAVTSLRIRYVRRIGSEPVDPAILAVCDAAAGHLAAMGHRVEEGEAPFDEARQAQGAVVTQAGMAWLLRNADWKGRIHDYYAGLVEKGSALGAVDYVDALAAQRAVQARIGLFFEDHDLLLSPVTGSLPGPADIPAKPIYPAFTGFANTAGIPAIAVPAGLSPDGLPIGIQFAGRFGADLVLLKLAHDYEQRHPWAHRWPPLAAGGAAEPPRAEVSSVRTT